MRIPWRGNTWLYMCLQLKNRWRMLRVLELRVTSKFEKEALEDDVLVLARLFSKLLDVRVVEESSIWKTFLISGI
jgi:hypothetical protein